MNCAVISKLPLGILSPGTDCPIVWEIVWSDPTNNNQFPMICQLVGQDPAKTGGFVQNNKRGTAWYFNEVGADRFLSANKLSHIVRAHQVPDFGFQFHFGDKCVTMFSCSHYCGNSNEAAVLFVDQETARALRIDTKNNAPATPAE